MNRLQELNQVIAEAELELEGMPEGRIVIAKNYILYVDSGKEQYLSAKKDKPLIQMLAQKQYLQQIIKSAKEEQKALLLYEKNSPSVPYEKIYAFLPEKKRSFTVPVKTPAAKLWEQERYRQKEPPSHSPHICPNGLKVRSKSEVLIASELLRFGIPFRYECGIPMLDHYWVYPDFTVFLPHLGRTMFYEHFGMMDSPEYALIAAKKLQTFQDNHFELGRDWVYTVETKISPLSLDTIDRIIQNYFLKQ